MVDAKQVSELRAKTNAGMMACKKALEAADGDMEKALEHLKRSGEIKAAQKTAERTTAEGVLATYVHHNRKLAALVELQCESDFVARNEDFVAFANDLAMQVAAMDPEYVSPESIPDTAKEEQRRQFLLEMEKDPKPEEIKEKILNGKMQKWMDEICLIKQPFLKDEDQTIEALLNQKIAVIGEKLVIARFVRWTLGV